jgi:hypothetical protein
MLLQKKLLRTASTAATFLFINKFLRHDKLDCFFDCVEDNTEEIDKTGVEIQSTGHLALGLRKNNCASTFCIKKSEITGNVMFI